MSRPHIVIGIGELLWDVFPDGHRLGGAPANFAYHCQQLGAEACPVSCVGEDALGREIRVALEDLGVNHTLVAHDSKHPTGTVQVSLDANGQPTYEICTDVAWDFIPLSSELKAVAERADAACFGSLAQRSQISRSTIHQFLKTMRPETLKIFDANLRQNFFTKETLNASLGYANLLKLSDDELPVLAELFGLTGSTTDQLTQLLQRFDMRLIAYTRGAKGSLLMTPDETIEHSGHPAGVVNSVGAGDSFTASLCLGLLNGHPLLQINDHANRVASYVCSQDSATPKLPHSLHGSRHAKRDK